MSQVTLTLLIRIRLWAGWWGAWWDGRSSRGRMLLVSILETSCLGCLDPLYPPSMAVPLIVGFCLALAEEQDIWEIYMKWWIWIGMTGFLFPFLTEHFILSDVFIWASVGEPLRSVKWTHTAMWSGFIWADSTGLSNELCATTVVAVEYLKWALRWCTAWINLKLKYILYLIFWPQR